MTVVQTPPVTVITVPPETAATTVTTVTTTTTAPVAPTVATTMVPAQTPTTTVADQPEDGLVVLVVLATAALAALLVIAAREFRRWRSKRSAPRVVLPAGATLADQVRAVAARAELDGPVEAHPILDVSVADLYPWLESPDDLTLVVDLRTAEALQQVGVTSLTQLADIDDAMVRSMIDAGIDIDTRAVEAAAQDVLSRKTDGQID